MVNSKDSCGSIAGAGPSATASDEERPIVFRGVALGYAQRPDICSTDEGYYGPRKDFYGGLPIKEANCCKTCSRNRWDQQFVESRDLVIFGN